MYEENSMNERVELLFTIFNLDNAKIEGYYPRELLKIIDEAAPLTLASGG